MSRHQHARKYPYGLIRKAILDALDCGLAYPPDQVAAACAILYGINDESVIRRNLGTLCTEGVVINVGSRRAALYQLPGKSNASQ